MTVPAAPPTCQKCQQAPATLIAHSARDELRRGRPTFTAPLCGPCAAVGIERGTVGRIDPIEAVVR